jgi:hypothetical protein
MQQQQQQQRVMMQQQQMQQVQRPQLQPVKPPAAPAALQTAAPSPQQQPAGQQQQQYHFAGRKRPAAEAVGGKPVSNKAAKRAAALAPLAPSGPVVVRPPATPAEAAEVEAWKAERRKHWPSASNLARKVRRANSRPAVFRSHFASAANCSVNWSLIFRLVVVVLGSHQLVGVHVHLCWQWRRDACVLPDDHAKDAPHLAGQLCQLGCCAHEAATAGLMHFSAVSLQCCCLSEISEACSCADAPDYCSVGACRTPSPPSLQHQAHWTPTQPRPQAQAVAAAAAGQQHWQQCWPSKRRWASPKLQARQTCTLGLTAA